MQYHPIIITPEVNTRLTCFLVLDLPVLNLIYRAINSLRPAQKKTQKKNMASADIIVLSNTHDK